MKFIPHSLTLMVDNSSIRSLIEFGSLVDPNTHSVSLPPLLNSIRLALKLFRGEPAITKFD